MPEVISSVAGLQLAMEIEAAESPAPSRAQAKTPYAGSEPAEPFERVLARLERGKRSERGVDRPGGERDPPDPADGHAAEPGEKDSAEPAAGAASVSVPTEASQESAGSPAVVDGDAVTASTGADSPAPDSPLTLQARSAFLGMLLEELPTILTAGPVAQTGEGVSPVAELGLQIEVRQDIDPSQLIRDGTPELGLRHVPLEVRQDIDPSQLIRDGTPELALRHVPFALRAGIDPVGQALGEARLDPHRLDVPGPPESANVASQPARPAPGLIEHAERVAPGSGSVMPGARPPPRMEWTGVLELTRLLDPSVEREAAPPRAPDPRPSDAPVWQPRPRVEASGTRPESTRYAQEPSAEFARSRAVDPMTWLPLTEVEGALRLSALHELGTMVQQAHGTALKTVLQTNPTGAAAEGAPAVQAVNPHLEAVTLPKLDVAMLVADVRQAVIRLAADGRGQARIVLHPPELGELIVRLESARNGVVRVEFHTISPLVREALEAGLTRLTEALKAEGLTLAQAEVHLSFHLGAEGQDGEMDSQSDEAAAAIGNFDDSAVESIAEDVAPAVERLPEGATISVYA